MKSTHGKLWREIREFRIDDGEVTLTFADRLARENGWHRGYAQRVVEEYKRFIFMAMVADHEVTPSDPVDEAWHLHLTYTQSYWGKLCREVLGRPLHHVPTRGGSSEQSRHLQQYERTLATYREHFGCDPPADIWPPASIRFSTPSNHVRIDRNRVWVVRKPRLPRSWSTQGSFVAGAFLAPLFVGVINPFELNGPQFLAFYVAICAIAIVAAFLLRSMLRSDEGTGEVNNIELSSYEIACLGGGAPGVLRACLASLLVSERLHRKEIGGVTTYHTSDPNDAGDHEIERLMLICAGHDSGATAREMLAGARPAAERMFSELQLRKLIESRGNFSVARWVPVALLVSVFLFGLAKIVLGVQRDKPVGFLVALLFGLAFLIGGYFYQIPLRTRGGDALLRRLQNQYAKLKTLGTGDRAPLAGSPPAHDDLILTAGLFGFAALHHPEITLLSSNLKPISTSSQSTGCGTTLSSDSGGCGGGDGGGCGSGCGGCGGGD